LRFSKEHLFLLTFVLFQTLRTQAAVDDANEQITLLLRHLALQFPHLKERAHTISGCFSDAAAMNLSTATRNAPFAFDLRWKLLINKTERLFITSDHPAVRYNQFLEARRPELSNTGIAIRGLQLFLPLAPRHHLVLFDSAVYKVGGMKLHNVAVDVTSEEDVAALNLLQAVNAGKALYFTDGTDIRHVREASKRAGKYRKGEKGSVSEHDAVHGITGQKGKIIKVSRADVRTGLDLKCMSVLPSATNRPLSGSNLELRDPAWFGHVSEFMRLNEAPTWPSAPTANAWPAEAERAILR
jgi:hypothetical protein